MLSVATTKKTPNAKQTTTVKKTQTTNEATTSRVTVKKLTATKEATTSRDSAIMTQTTQGETTSMAGATTQTTEEGLGTTLAIPTVEQGRHHLNDKDENKQFIRTINIRAFYIIFKVTVRLVSLSKSVGQDEQNKVIRVKSYLFTLK